MPFDLQTPETKEFRLERLDAAHDVSDDEATMVTIRQATVRHNARRAELFGTIKQQRNADGSEYTVYDLPLYRLNMVEVYLTMIDCNITWQGKPLFNFKKNSDGTTFLNMKESDFEKAWGLLPEEAAVEIHEKVLEVNPGWLTQVTDEGLVDLGE